MLVIFRAWLLAAILALAASPMRAAMSLRNDAPLAFGSLIAGSASGGVTVTPAGVRTTTPAVFPFGSTGFGSASFTVTIPKGNPHFTIILPSNTTITSGGGANMMIDTFQSQPAGGGDVDSKTGTATVVVGATLHVGASQQPGSYSGSFVVVVSTP